MRENKNIFQYLSVCKTLILVGSNIIQAKTVTYSHLLILLKTGLSKKYKKYKIKNQKLVTGNISNECVQK